MKKTYRLWLGSLLVACAFALSACGSSGSDACKKACDKVNMCIPGSNCQPTGDCTGAAQTSAECVNSKSCEELNTCFTTGG